MNREIEVTVTKEKSYLSIFLKTPFQLIANILFYLITTFEWNLKFMLHILKRIGDMKACIKKTGTWRRQNKGHSLNKEQSVLTDRRNYFLLTENMSHDDNGTWNEIPLFVGCKSQFTKVWSFRSKVLFNHLSKRGRKRYRVNVHILR